MDEFICESSIEYNLCICEVNKLSVIVKGGSSPTLKLKSLLLHAE